MGSLQTRRALCGDAGERPVRQCRCRGRRPWHLPLYGHPGVGRTQPVAGTLDAHLAPGTVRPASWEAGTHRWRTPERLRVAALLADGDAAEIHVVYWHYTPEFAASDWHFVDPLMDLTATVPGWFRNLPSEEREAIAKTFWAEGRLKLEPWLTSRLEKPFVHRWPNTSVIACEEVPDGEIEARLSTGERLAVDHVVLATGYKPDMREVPYLSGVIDRMELADGFPVLDDHFQSSVPGLFVTGFPATRDFGPFFGFVRGCPVAATLTTVGLAEALNRT